MKNTNLFWLIEFLKNLEFSMRKIIFIFFVFLCTCNILAQGVLVPIENKLMINQKLDIDISEKYFNSYSSLNLFGQGLAGFSGGMGFSLATYYSTKGNKLHDSNENIKPNILLLLSYVVGSATGVYFVSQLENSNTLFWETVGYSVIGGSIGVVILTATFDGRDLSPFGIISFLALPIISSMIYSSYIVDWSEDNKINRDQVKSITHNDLLNSNLINILKIKIPI